MKTSSRWASCASRPSVRPRLRTTWPRSGSSRPEARRSSVVLPAPFGPDEADPVAQGEPDVDPVEDDERPDLAGDLGEAQDRHQAAPAPVPDAARAAARRVAAARFVRSVRERALARAASSGVDAETPLPGQLRPATAAPPWATGHRPQDRAGAGAGRPPAGAGTTSRSGCSGPRRRSGGAAGRSAGTARRSAGRPRAAPASPRRRRARCSRRSSCRDARRPRPGSTRIDS